MPDELHIGMDKYAQREEPVKIGILRILSESSEPVGSTTIARKLVKKGLHQRENGEKLFEDFEEKNLIISHGKDGFR
ncbi:MAG: hypothetical protein FGF51_08520 [Candidatus Brockarchaeota archaeon]|nr:hypothetical protein [Candidatus Brockarchaeota archaeon]